MGIKILLNFVIWIMCELLIMWIQDCMMKFKIAKDKKKIT
jgi:hypothetical protein